MERELIPTEDTNGKNLWIIRIYDEGTHKEFSVHANEIDVAIYEVLTAKDFNKSMITQITRY
jgi:hypothetical protein